MAKHNYMHNFLLVENMIGTDENNMKIKMCTVLLTTIREARNYSQDVNYCQYHLGIDHCQDGNCYQDRDRCYIGWK